MKQSKLASICQAGVLLSLVLAGRECISQAPTEPSQTKAAATPEFQGFRVELTLSDNASKTLIARSETIVVVGYLSGSPKPGTPRRYVDEMGQVSLGEIKKEIAPGQTAAFGSFKIDRPGLKWIDNQGLQLLINVYSGRKSSPDNLLDCGIYEGPLKDVQGKSIPVSCKLIGE
jgi:hypothetical protein